MGENQAKIEDQIKSIFGIKIERFDAINYIKNSIITGALLSDAVDFLKKLGALNEFVETLNISDKEFFLALFEARPKILGGNPLE